MSVENKTAALPDVVPTVVFDVGLGKTTEYIDFDYHAFNELFMNNGAGPADIDTYTIHFADAPVGHMAKRAKYSIDLNGHYDKKRNQSSINSPETVIKSALPLSDADARNAGLRPTAEWVSRATKGILNDTLIHESYHWLDRDNNSLQKFKRRMAAKLAGCVGVAGMVGYPTGEFIHPVAGVIAGVVTFMGASATVTDNIKRRYPNASDFPWETGAYAFEEANHHIRIVDHRFRPGVAQKILADYERSVRQSII